MKLTDKQYRDAIDWVVMAQRGRFPIERGHIDAIADILLSPKEKAAGKMFDALEQIRFICTAEGHAPCRCGGMAYGEVCANTCMCEGPDDIKPIVASALAKAVQP